MMKYPKKALILCFMLLITISLSACSKSSTKDVSNNGADFSGNMMPDAGNSNSKFGKVTAIDGNKITLALLERPNFQDRLDNAPSGTPNPDGRSKDNFPSGAPDKGTRPDKDSTSKDASGDAKKPDASSMEGRGNPFNETGETLDITVDNKTTIKTRQKQQESEGSLKDITVDSILTVNYADDGSISEIIVQSSMGRK